MREKRLGVFMVKSLKGIVMSSKLNESQKMACNLLATGMKTSEILNQLKIRQETLSRWKQKEDFKSCLQKTQEKVLESIIETQKHILILSQDIIIQALKNETLDDFKKAMIALRYINLIKGKNNIEEKYSKQLSDLSFENVFGFK